MAFIFFGYGPSASIPNPQMGVCYLTPHGLFHPPRSIPFRAALHCRRTKDQGFISPGNYLVDEKFSNCCGHIITGISNKYFLAFWTFPNFPTSISGLHFTMISSQDRKSGKRMWPQFMTAFQTPNERKTINKLSGGAPRLCLRVISFKRGNKVNWRNCSI